MPMPLTLSEYQAGALSTALYHDLWPDGRYNLVYPALGLAGEAGEFVDKVKKLVRDHARAGVSTPQGAITPELYEALVKELGDVLWYVATCAHDLGVDLDEVGRKNLEKLAARKAGGKLHGSGDNR